MPGGQAPPAGTGLHVTGPQFCLLTHSTPAGQTASPQAVAEASPLLSDDLHAVTATSASNAHDSDGV